MWHVVITKNEGRSGQASPQGGTATSDVLGVLRGVSNGFDKASWALTDGAIPVRE